MKLSRLHHLTCLQAELYNGIYQYVLGRQDICELTVEDPAEAFEDLRDQNDLKMLLSNQRFMEEGFGSEAASHGGGRVGGVGRAGKSGKGGNATVAVRGRMFPPIDRAWVKSWRRQLKIADVGHDILPVVSPSLTRHATSDNSTG